MCGDVLENATGTFSEFSKALNNLDRSKAQLLYSPQDDVYRLDTEED